MKIQKENSHENTTRSEMGEQNVQAKKVHFGKHHINAFSWQSFFQ